MNPSCSKFRRCEFTLVVCMCYVLCWLRDWVKLDWEHCCVVAVVWVLFSVLLKFLVELRCVEFSFWRLSQPGWCVSVSIMTECWGCSLSCWLAEILWLFCWVCVLIRISGRCWVLFVCQVYEFTEFCELPNWFVLCFVRVCFCLQTRFVAIFVELFSEFVEFAECWVAICCSRCWVTVYPSYACWL